MDRPPSLPIEPTDRAQLAERHLDLVRRVAATIHARCYRHVDLDELVALGTSG
jgi:hypothetical protein